ncbi:actin-histidine N-methyltransferase isoform X2 [Cuculus canorus]|uniref:actin-histidine N-methyltransferase isoform X2 n=1 Tax=Cuculus canorus TaxID=55661 RepID=UPI0023AA6ADA|nr:actin-histidine N-methyltransferase isoform X2 [Cuculus canorus]
MGKKSRVKTQKSGTGATATVSPKEMLNLISELLQKCSSPTPGPGKEWEEYVQIRSLVEKIRKKQKGLSVVFEGKRDDYFPELMKWATENGASTEGFEIANSFWLPYIQTLPSEYDTPLYFEEDEVQYLQSTQAIHDVFSQYKNTARQYAYFYKVTQTHPNASKLPLKDSFTYDDYRWAVSSVMTRQNQIPTEDGSRVTLALIPLWDMCNHTNGLITTGYNLEDDRCECVALQDFKAGEQIYIFYGTRSNAEFVIHSGFFFDNNSHDRVKIKLGVSKSDRLYAMKAEVLARAGIPTSSSVFALHSTEPPISAQLLAFLRVFCMTEEELKQHLIGEHAIDKIFTLGNSEFPVSWENEVKLWTFLEARASLLLKTYKTTVEDDKSFLETHDLTSHAVMAIKLRLGEKEILEKAVKSAAASREYYTKQMADGAPLPKYEESTIALLENTVADSRLPIVLRNLEDVEEQRDLKIGEAIDAEVAENGFVNGENSLFNGIKSESENLNKEKSNRKTEDAKESSSESTYEVKE